MGLPDSPGGHLLKAPPAARDLYRNTSTDTSLGALDEGLGFHAVDRARRGVAAPLVPVGEGRAHPLPGGRGPGGRARRGHPPAHGASRGPGTSPRLAIATLRLPGGVDPSVGSRLPLGQGHAPRPGAGSAVSCSSALPAGRNLPRRPPSAPAWWRPWPTSKPWSPLPSLATLSPCRLPHPLRPRRGAPPPRRP